MQSHFWNQPIFWHGVLASLFATAIWAVGGAALEPLWGYVAVTYWAGIAEWLHQLGWLAFLVTIAVWYVNRRSSPVLTNAPSAHPSSGATMPASIPKIEVTTTNYPMRVDVASTTTLIAWKNKYALDEGGQVDLVKGSVHVELWNRHGRNRTNKPRFLRFT